jgi:ATP-dependent protease Clp ATPase subunit
MGLGRTVQLLGEAPPQVAGMASAGDTQIICNQCLELCEEILSDEPPVPRR